MRTSRPIPQPSCLGGIPARIPVSPVTDTLAPLRLPAQVSPIHFPGSPEEPRCVLASPAHSPGAERSRTARRAAPEGAAAWATSRCSRAASHSASPTPVVGLQAQPLGLMALLGPLRGEGQGPQRRHPPRLRSWGCPSCHRPCRRNFAGLLLPLCLGVAEQALSGGAAHPRSGQPGAQPRRAGQPRVKPAFASPAAQRRPSAPS